MKKLIAGLAGIVLLVPGVGSVAFAGPGDGYPGVVKTTTKVSGPSKARVGQTKTYTAKLIVASSGNPCKGNFDLKVTKGSKTVKEASKGIGGGKQSFKVKFNMGAGKYRVKVRFVPKNNNACKGSHDEKTVKVKKKR